MRVYTALTAMALTAAAALFVTACGSGNKSSTTTVGAQTGTPSPNVSTEPADPVAKRPALETSKEFNTVFENWTSSDAKTNSVLIDGKYQTLAVNSAIFKLNPNAPEVAFYNVDESLASAKDWIAGFKQNHLTMVGTVRYYDPQVTFPTSDVATLSYCSDESKGYSKDLRTGKVDVTQPSSNSYVFYSTSLARTSRGIWQTISFTSQRGKCQP